MGDDPRRDAARYRLARDTGDTAEQRPAPSVEQLRSNAEIAIQQAMRRGDFDDLPGAGKPLTGLTGRHDPDWWNLQLDDRLDAMHREEDVRAALEDFNHRVIEARRQLLGGPPVVTPTRDIEAEVRAWRERRA